MPTSNVIRQLPIEFPHRPSLDKEDFLVAECNIEAVEMIDRWPDWPYFAVCIYGSEGCGKSHLANVFSNNVSRHDNYPYRIPSMPSPSVSGALLPMTSGWKPRINSSPGTAA